MPSLVGEFEKFLRLQLAFQPDRVQPHVFDVTEFVVQALRVFAQHHVGRPAAAANQNVFAVDVERASANGVEVRSDFANAELESSTDR